MRKIKAGEKKKKKLRKEKVIVLGDCMCCGRGKRKIGCAEKDGERSNHFLNWVTKHDRGLVTTTPRRQRLEDGKFEAHLSYTVEPQGNDKGTNARDKS